MGMMGNIAIESELMRMQEMLDEWGEQGIPAWAQLEQLKEHIEQTIQLAKSGWL